MPELNTSSLPDLIFSVLFFFMMVTSMRKDTPMVTINKPVGTQLEKLVRKSCTSYINVGRPTEKNREYGSGTHIQVNDKFVEAFQIYDFVMEERGKLAEIDKPFYTVSIKGDKDVPMGYITDIKQALRKSYALKILYSANKDNK